MGQHVQIFAIGLYRRHRGIIARFRVRQTATRGCSCCSCRPMLYIFIRYSNWQHTQQISPDVSLQMWQMRPDVIFFYVAFAVELQKKKEQNLPPVRLSSLQICCSTTLRKLNVQLHALRYSSKRKQSHLFIVFKFF